MVQKVKKKGVQDEWSSLCSEIYSFGILSSREAALISSRFFALQQDKENRSLELLPLRNFSVISGDDLHSEVSGEKRKKKRKQRETK
jgi:hypothetical protein